MDDYDKTKDGGFYKDITEDGKLISIFVTPKNDKKTEWELVIEGKEGHFSVWDKYFNTVEEAMNAGLSAVLNEGFKEFYSDIEFEEYLSKSQT